MVSMYSKDRLSLKRPPVASVSGGGSGHGKKLGQIRGVGYRGGLRCVVKTSLRPNCAEGCPDRRRAAAIAGRRGKKNSAIPGVWVADSLAHVTNRALVT